MTEGLWVKAQTSDPWKVPAEPLLGGVNGGREIHVNQHRGKRTFWRVWCSHVPRFGVEIFWLAGF